MNDFFYENRIHGIIFDCDGVLVDSEKMSCGALNVVFEKYFNIDIGRDYTPIIGKRLKDGFAYYFNKFNIKVPPSLELDVLYKEKDQAYQNLARGKLQAFPGVTSLLEFLEKQSFKKAVASSGSIDKISFNLEQSNLKKHFSILSSADEVSHGKPAPDLFLLTAEKLKLKPEVCAVVEDSVLGIQGAKSANMVAIGVTTSFNKEELFKNGADVVVERVDELLQL